MDAHFAFRISRELLAELHKIAEAEDRSVAQIVRRALKEYVEAQKNAEA